MITNKDIYGLHTSVDSEPSELYEAYQDVPLDSLDESRKNNTPLHTACHFADMTAVGILLDRGADPNVKNDDGDTPLCVMARRGPRPDDAGCVRAHTARNLSERAPRLVHLAHRYGALGLDNL